VCVCVCVCVCRCVVDRVRHKDRFTPSTSASPANYHLTECSKLLSHQSRYNGPTSGLVQNGLSLTLSLILSTAAGTTKQLTAVHSELQKQSQLHSTKLTQMLIDVIRVKVNVNLSL
jgi:hypothetical protein